MTRLEDHIGVVEAACNALDGVEEYGICEGDASGLLVLHGLAMYAHDTARSSALLLREGRTLSASALARVVIEHAVLAQWLKAGHRKSSRLRTGWPGGGIATASRTSVRWQQ
jgi:hypothetical protein